METDDVSVREQLFHNRVRETIICVLLFTCLYMLSYLILNQFRKTAEFVTDDVEDATVNKIALWLCTFTLSVAVCAVLLLPISILSNEVLLTFPQSYYMQWLNGSLIHGTSVHTKHQIEILCTPLGLSRMFSVTGSLLVKPRLLEDVEDTLSCTTFEEDSLSRKINCNTSCWVKLNMEALKKEYQAVQSKRVALEMRRKASPWQRNLGYPLAMLVLLALTVMCVLMVCFNVLELLLDETAMPRGMEDPHLGMASFSMFGSLGAAVQVVLILYLMVSSVVGFYSSPLFTGLLPRAQDTNLTQIIANCVSLLILSSALPVFSRTLGITRFDLLGDFGRYNWLGNFYVVFLYNMLFAGLTSASLIKTVTWAVQRELIRAFGLHRLPLTVSRSTVPFRLLLASGLSKIQ
uniref:Limb development membrane protein 1-like n=1 Tax=Neolamprologus brichardi TaxID=32507 RepID=A0A3Q4HII1_NEOBR